MLFSVELDHELGGVAIEVDDIPIERDCRRNFAPQKREPRRRRQRMSSALAGCFRSSLSNSRRFTVIASRQLPGSLTPGPSPRRFDEV